MLWTWHPTFHKVKTKFPNLRPPCCMPRSKMMRNSWILKERLQCILARRLLKKKKKIDDDKKTKEPKGDGHIVGLYLRQRVKNL